MASLELLERVVALAKSGDRLRARGLLWQSLEDEPADERAWLLYSELEDAPQEKIAALQKAIALNPQNERARARLQHLLEQVQREQQLQQKQQARQARQVFQAALQAHKEKQNEETLRLLLQYVEIDSRNETAWLMLSNLVPELADQVIALENALTLNPGNTKTRKRLQKLRSLADEPLSRGIYYEQHGDLERAIAAYLEAEQKGQTPAVRAEAQRRIAIAQFHRDQPKYRVVNPALTLARLTAGPVILYLALVLIQSGLNPVHTPLLLCLSGPFVLLGSFLLVISRSAPSRTLWLRFFGGQDGGSSYVSLIAVTLLGWVSMLAPFALLIWHSLQRLL
jgi:hypothetical protein